MAHWANAGAGSCCRMRHRRISGCSAPPTLRGSSSHDDLETDHGAVVGAEVLERAGVVEGEFKGLVLSDISAVEPAISLAARTRGDRVRRGILVGPRDLCAPRGLERRRYGFEALIADGRGRRGRG